MMASSSLMSRVSIDNKKRFDRPCAYAFPFLQHFPTLQRRSVQRIFDDLQHAFRHDWTDAVSYLPKAVPFGRRKGEPIRETLEAGSLPRRNYPGLNGMDWSDGLITASIRAGTGPQGRTKAIRVQNVELLIPYRARPV